MKTYLENRGSKNGVESNKFYEVEIKGKKLICRWGATSKYKELKDVYNSRPGVKIITSNATQKYQEQIEKKKKRGYVIVSTDNVQVEARPDSNGRKFGIEIETNTNISKLDLKNRLQSRGLEVKVINGYENSNGKKWDIKNDSSCGYEIASPILSGDAGIFDVKLSIDKIKESLNDTHVPDSRCGIHITLDVSDLTSEQMKTLIISYLKTQEYFYSLCNESRQNNEYCRKYPVSNIRNFENKTYLQIAAALRIDKYYGLNLSKYRYSKLIEFRMFQSELSPRKVALWLRTCLGFVNAIRSNVISKSSSKDKIITSMQTVG